ncbi:MAG: membrane protein insertase YidC [Lachnospiraceae bacterium]|nr:membrane protein insertase YidC [Lachnospiraceae bacterium]
MFLYNLTIKPLITLFEIVYGSANEFLWNYGLSIVALSLAMNFLVLPLYARADAIQAQVNAKEAKLAPWIKKIKENFKGDERYMILSAYYRESGYSVFAQLGNLLPLMLEIPFFIAAYKFLSTYEALRGVSFGPIANLGEPDELLTIGALSINVLPILMTLINIISGTVYSKGLPAKAKIQLYGMAVIFLVFLYKSPSGLVLYWTLNNLFSLFKNIFYKLKHPRQILASIAGVLGVMAVIYGIFFSKSAYYTHATHQMIIVITGALLMLPGILMIRNRVKGSDNKKVTSDAGNAGTAVINYFLASVYLTLLTGVLIPSAAIASSAEEFISIIDPKNPGIYIGNAIIPAIGTFILWMSVFFFLTVKDSRRKFASFVWSAAMVFTAEYLFFSGKYGTMTAKLIYDREPIFTFKQMMVNLVILVAVGAVAFFISRYERIVGTVLAAMILAVTGLGIKNVMSINSQYRAYERDITTGSVGNPEIILSPTGKNVLVIMIDRAIDGYIPYIMNEKPELKEKFDGFTWYPDNISYGSSTIFGAPGLFGGYDYTPEMMNRRSDELLANKHEEALKTLPTLLGEDGYHVTVLDPPYAGYSEIPDLSIYDGIPGVDAYNTRRFSTGMEQSERIEKIKSGNFFRFGLFCTMPQCVQMVIYDGGCYYDQTAGEPDYSEAYYSLRMLEEITTVSDGYKGGALIMDNDTAHDSTLLQKPDYTPARYVSNSGYHSDNELHDDEGNVIHFESNYQEGHYDHNMLAMMVLGDYFDRLRELGVYDNTKIILVSDHGTGLDHLESLVFDNGLDAEWFNALLMVKDYDATGFTTDKTFMTNADVPAIALEGIIDDPKNPFTGSSLDMSRKQGVQHVLFSESWDVMENNGNVFKIGGNGQWYEMQGSIFDEDSWKAIDDPVNGK